MPAHIDYDDPKYAEAAREVLRRHDAFEAEANITSAVRRFLTETGLVQSDEIVEENPPAEGSRQAVDLTALDTFIEFKRRTGSTSGFDPNPDYVEQLDDYLAQSQEGGRVRMGVLTDGRHWLLRWPGAGPVKLVQPYAFTLDDADRWPLLHAWLRDNALSAESNVVPTRESIAKHFGPDSPHYERDIAAFAALYSEYAAVNTIKVKRELWEKLLTAALGEIAFTRDAMDNLFVRHTYLTAVVGMVVQASFGIDILAMVENDPEDLLYGRDFRSKTGLQGVVESDFFAWPAEVGGRPLLRTLARRVVKFDWRQSPSDIASILYETVIPPEERRQLGEYYTPDWLARAIVRELVTDPLGPVCARPGLRLRHFRGGGGRPPARGRRQDLPRSQGYAGVAALLRGRHRRPPGRGAPRPRRVGAGRTASHTGRCGHRLRSPASPCRSTWETRCSYGSALATCSRSMRSRSRWRTSRTPSSCSREGWSTAQRTSTR